MFGLDAFKQAENRELFIFTDQWDRPWEVMVDRQARKLAWVWSYPKFKVPHKSFVPPEKYRKGTNVLGKLRIDMDAWIADNAKSHDYFNDQLLRVCQAQNAQNALELVKHPTREILRLMGPEPMPEAFLRAMRAGNRWALGLTTEEPKWLDEDPKYRLWLAQKNIRRGSPQDHEADLKYADDEKYADLEERHDPEALGGKVERVASPKQKLYRDLVRDLGPKEAARQWREMKAQKEREKGAVAV